jgi:tetratricopeptide (TPR) repeat protein
LENKRRQDRLPAFLKRKERGDVVVGDVGESARGVVIGKNVVQIGTLVVPARLAIVLVVLLVGLVAGSAFLAWNLWVPDHMTGLFNIAVAEFGEVDAQGQVHPSPRGQLISRRLFDGLRIEFDNLPFTVRQDMQPQLWHDSLGLTQKRAGIGLVPGQTPEARAEAARQLARRINAHVVIYGNLPANGSGAGFVPEVYVSPDAGVDVETDKIAGVYQPIGAIPVQLLDKASDPIAGRSITIRLNSWTNVLSLFTIGLMYDLLGYPGRALPVLQQAKDELASTVEEGNPVLWFFIGREALWLKRDQEAQPAFEQALQLDPNYARARLGLGDIRLNKAYSQSPAERIQAPDLEQAITEYTTALETAEPSVKGEALYSLGIAYRLKGETWLNLADYSAADTALAAAVEHLSATLDTLKNTERYRLLAQTYLSLGEAYEDQGHAQLRQDNQEGGHPFFEQALASYDQCIQQGAAAPTDLILTDKIIGKLCVPYKKLVEEELARP